MKIVIPGGSGQVGTVLARALHHWGHEVVVLSRRPVPRSWRVSSWKGVTLGDWAKEIDGCDAVINLAGRSVNCRYNAANRRAILDSRVLSTHVVAQAVSSAKRPPRVWLQASTATIYAHRYDAPNDEATGIVGGLEPGAPSSWKFSIDVARAWEAAFAEAVAPPYTQGCTSVRPDAEPRSGRYLRYAARSRQRGLGGTAGDGRQYVSWIHHEDFVAAVRWLLAHDEVDGVVNVAAPTPLPNEEFMRVLRQAAGVPLGLSASRLMLEAGAIFMRTETELILKSRRVVPARLLERGFVFRYPNWRDAARDLCREWRQVRQDGARVA